MIFVYMCNILLNLNNTFKTKISSVCFKTKEQIKIIITEYYMIISQNIFVMLTILRWPPIFPLLGVYGLNKCLCFECRWDLLI